MKILFCISTLTNAGAERAMSNITTHLPQNVQADLLLNSISSNDFPTNANVISLGMKPVSKKNFSYQLKAFVKRNKKLKELKRKNQYDACITFMESANVSNILTRMNGCKTIVSVRLSVEQEKTKIYKYVVRPIMKILYSKADVVVACSEGINLGLRKKFHIDEKKIVTITNGYDIDDIRRQMKDIVKVTIEKGKDDFWFVAVGRLCTQKGHWHLVRAFAKLSRQYPNAKLLIAGEGPDHKYLETLIGKYGLENNVYLLGQQKNIFALLDKCDAYVMPSLFEGYSNALCEALICGLPCIASDFQTSAREILAPETSIEYQNKTEIEYAQYGIITPVCSGKKYMENEELERAEICLIEAMGKLMQDQEIYEKYREAAVLRGEQLRIEDKVEEWINLVY